MSPEAAFVLLVIIVRSSKAPRAGPSPRRAETVTTSTLHLINMARAAFLI